MKINELFSIISPEDYKNINIEGEEIPNIEELNGRSPMRFSVLANDERRLYENEPDKQNFCGSSETIKIFNIEVEDYYSIIRDKDSSGMHTIVMKKLQKYCNQVPAEYVFITHMLLHEVGHYQQYIDKGRNVYEYINWCEDQKRENYMKQQKLTEQIQNRVNKCIPPFGPNKGERIKLENLTKEYLNIPIEKEANDFAYAHMKQAVDKLKNYFKDCDK